MAQVVLQNVSKIFGADIVAVKDVNLDIKDKEFLVLVGPSGCGKSTTLKMIAGLESISQGNIYIGEKKVNNIHPKDRDIAMVFQNYALYPHMNVYKNMAFGLKLRKYPHDEIDKRVKEASEMLHITNLLNRKPRALSGGQRQRVAVGRAIVRKPQVFLFDEPLSNLDAKFRVQMRTEISKLHKRLQTTMIYVTHDQVEAMTMGNRIVIMKDGVVQQVDVPLEIYNNPINKFVGGFIGSPPMNFINGALIPKNAGLYFKASHFTVKVSEDKIQQLQPYTNKDIIMGIRPEDLYDRHYVSDAHPENIIKTSVEVIEPMGSEVYYYLKSGNDSMIARLDVQEHAQVNQEIDLAFNMKKAHFFDPVTEIRIA